MELPPTQSPMLNRPLSRFSNTQVRLPRYRNSGFTLPEVLVSAVILLIAVIGSIAAFNLITQSIRGTGLRAEQNRVIDEDISVITDISERFTPCVVASGSVLNDPSLCTGVDVAFGNSYFYFPSDPDDRDDFFAACRNGGFRTNFIAAIGGPQVLDSGVERQRPTPVAGSDNVISIIWRDASRADRRMLREIQTSSLASSWCP